MQDKAGTSPDQQQEHSTEKDESGDQAPEAVDSAVPASKGERSGLGINPFGAYHVVSSAASYLHSRAMGIMPFGPGNDAKDDPTIMAFVSGESSDGLSLDEASFVATTNSVTSMVAAKEEERQAVADDLNSSRSCPCEWFVCDDDQNSTRYFVVQVLLIYAQIFMVVPIYSFCSSCFLIQFCAIVVVCFCDLQGSESIASWQANLLFEPVKFEV